MLAILAPGQGAQTPGMLHPWLDLPGATARLRWFSAAAGLDLVELGTEAAAETIKDTAVAQPLIVATGLLAAEQLGLPAPGAVPAGAPLVAGHSVGEITAAVLSGALPAETALVLVALRGRAMAEASARTPTGMSAVLGGDPEEVAAHLEGLGLTPANRNGAGQIVAAGDLDALAKLSGEPLAGTRVRPLAVAGAFHTHFMASARDTLAEVAPGVRAGTPRLGQVSNADGAVVTDGADMLGRLVGQVSAPVRWDLCMATLRELGVTAVIELPPAGTLVGIARRELPGVKALAVKSPADLAAARELLAEHLGPAAVTIPAPASEPVPAGTTDRVTESATDRVTPTAGELA
ncbi:ACP S-malonyltransferase [Frankia sp. CNm7]|uniref:Malonyl CoA-acyl carrier protein transacylase n=1 Tax=Frankia nepalensis TaxID=1836974 RepID=A0A937UNT5_9ACTN|nr:ACP S-malonyltransferase [Frankia nepalensis]MBL7498196.1 ACP S-malonyltransferase [Frankia nepalensis]MBL7515921.1 ACP S-malonyltransferase [Frankia nepalensis]MBL7522226.1 ACP S-malonyltransferase [Frankia nepalensis]MBL7628408.1 ACP S-malonyltransferase [Frankia nepalensis]